MLPPCIPTTDLGSCTSLFEVGVGLSLAGSIAKSFTDLVTNRLARKLQDLIEFRTVHATQGAVRSTDAAEFRSDVITARLAILQAKDRWPHFDASLGPINWAIGLASFGALIWASLLPNTVVDVFYLAGMVVIVSAPAWISAVDYLIRRPEIREARNRVAELEKKWGSST